MKYNHYHTYVLKRALPTFLLICMLATVVQAQTIQLKGHVTSGQGDTAVSGASIKVKGTNTGTIANADGSFSMTVQPNATLIVSAVGYVQQQVAVNNQTNIPVYLTND